MKYAFPIFPILPRNNLSPCSARNADNAKRETGKEKAALQGGASRISPPRPGIPRPKNAARIVALKGTPSFSRSRLHYISSHFLVHGGIPRHFSARRRASLRARARDTNESPISIRPATRHPRSRPGNERGFRDHGPLGPAEASP